jgi:two-component system NtrC family sensor kinase
MNLILKVTLAITALLILIMIPFIYLNVSSVEDLLYEEAVSEADVVSETIIKTTRFQMLENDRRRLYQMVQEAGSQENIEDIRMINKEGIITFSTNPKEMGVNIEKDTAVCNPCHIGRRPPLEVISALRRSRIIQAEGGRELLGISKPIFNDERCSSASCHFHPPDQNILGVLYTTVSLETMHARSAQYTQRLILLTFSMLFLIGATLTMLIRRQVSRPIGEILNHTKKIGELEFGTEIPDLGRDEIGDLARSFNGMTRKLDHATKELEEWGHTLEQKVEERTAEIRHMQAQLIQSEKLASLGEIVAGIAHELNNPLTGVIVYSSLMEKDEKLSATHREDVASIIHESQRCARIVKGLLKFSRVASPQKLMASVNSVMDNTLSLIGTQSIFHNVNIRKRYDADMRETLIDPNQIEQVFINLLINAGQAMPEGGNLDIITQVNAGHVTVSIRDTGCGIPPEHLPRIFDPFFSTKESAGTGLGLSVSYGIVESHGGTIKVESVVGKGTEFIVQIPLLASEGLNLS